MKALLDWMRLRLRPPQAIPDPLWDRVLQRYPFLGWRSTVDLERLRALSLDFLRTKEFSGAHGFEVNDERALSVAAQACLPVLNLGLSGYSGFVGIVLHEGPVRARREVLDEAGVLHTFDEELVGEALDGGPVMLCWQDGVDHPTTDGHPAFNVVVHEFVHLLDLLDGVFDGTPPLPVAERAPWQHTLQVTFDRFDERRACGYASVIDTYGAQDLGEFFAVTVEAFFTQPCAFADEQPELHGLYTRYFQQDPARDEQRWRGTNRP